MLHRIFVHLPPATPALLNKPAAASGGSNYMPTEKDERTELVRAMLKSCDELRETDRADSGLTTLSFQSVSHSQRHVWIDTDLAGDISIDLEDWTDNENWDNSVANVTTHNLEEAASTAIAWLRGS